MKASPAFQFYPDRWLGGTSHLSPAARGIYLDLLCWQWNHVKPLPTSATTRAQIGRCTLEQFTSAWVEIADKFQETTQGFANDALERVRGEGMVFLESQREKAKLGAAARWKDHKKDAPANAPGIAPANAPPMPSISISISNSDLDLHGAVSLPDQAKTKTDVLTRSSSARERVAENNHAKPTNLVNGSDMRRHGQHEWCAHERDGLCIPRFLHLEFVGKSGKSAEDVRAWYSTVLTRYEGKPIGEDALVFWRNEFAQWVGVATVAPKRFETRAESNRKVVAEVSKRIAEGKIQNVRRIGKPQSSRH